MEKKEVGKDNASKKKHGISLGIKLNLLIVAGILIVSTGILMVAYDVHCRQVDRLYYDQTERASKTAKDFIDPDAVDYLWEVARTEEFRAVREKALEAEDESILIDWMDAYPSSFGEDIPEYTLFTEYDVIRTSLLDICETFSLEDVYVQRDENGISYNLIDPMEDCFIIGQPDPSIAAFDPYEDNAQIPATVYHSPFGWLCTACEPIRWEGEEAVGIVCADMDMDEVVKGRQWFLLNSFALILLLTAGAIVINMLLIRHIAVKPLLQLRKGTCGFTESENGYTLSDVMDLDIRSGDEIEDLYQEIRSMQTHIVNYTNDLARVTAEQEHARTELNLAAKIQESALPAIEPDFSGRPEYSISALMDPAKDVGGDFYDFFYLDDTHLALVIADVSGKGVPAALFMMSAKNMIASRAAAGGTPAEILSDVNAGLSKNNEAQMFVTVWLGILDLETGVLTASNAGHERPALRLKDGSFELLNDKHGFVLAGMPSVKYRDYEITLAPGDTVFVYTDGVPEASDAEQNFFGTDRMLSALNALPDGEPEELIAAVKNSINAFIGDAEQFDDLTMLCLKYKGSQKEK